MSDIDYSQPTPEADAFYNQIFDSEIDGGAIHAKLKDFECERNHFRARLQTAEQQLGRVREEVRGLRDKLERIQSDASQPQIIYDKLGPEWTTKEGLELYSASAHLGFANEIKELATAALSAAPSDGCGKGRTDGDQFLILSLSHSPADGNALWWGPNNSGYAQCVENAGRYTLEQVTKEKSYYDNGDSTKAFPLSEALRLGRSGTKVDWLDAKHVASKLEAASSSGKEGEV